MKEKKNIVFMVLGLLFLVIMIAGATYAYFQAQTNKGAHADINATIGTTDNLTFSAGDGITFVANTENFGPLGNDLYDETTATAILKANNTTNVTGDYTYNIYLEIDKNDFEYTSYKKGIEITAPEAPATLTFTNEYDKTLGNNIDYNGLTYGYEGIPELYLTIIDPNGEELEEINLGEGYAHYMNLFDKGEEQEGQWGGYDITELREGIYSLVKGYKIKVEEKDKGSKEQDWQVRVTFKNLGQNQNLNSGKTFTGKIIIQKEAIPTNLMDVCTEGEKLSECIQRLHDNSVYGASNLIYHDGKKDYGEEENSTLEAGDKSYRYTGANEKVNNYICFGTGAESYYANSESVSCPEDNLYRIMGTFKNGEEYETKLIKADYANKDLLGTGTEKEERGDSTTGSYASVTFGPIEGSTNSLEEKDGFAHRYKGSLDYVDRYKWQENGEENTQANWPEALLNKQHLNKEFYNHLIGNNDESKWSKLIINHTWKYGNSTSTWTNIVLAENVKSAYDNEIGNQSNNESKTDSQHIGLMYVSDYLYAASQDNWNKKLWPTKISYNVNNTNLKDYEDTPIGTFPEKEIDGDYRSATDDNWMYLGLWEWMITQRANSTNRAFALYAAGYVTNGIVGSTDVGASAYVVRPTFYISNEAIIKGGEGTKTNPYVLEIS